MAAEDDGKDVLNRSRRDRLTKAAKQGYGPWADVSQRSRAVENAARVRHPLAAVSEHAPRAPLLRQQKAATIRRSAEDEPDLSSFLASKPPGSAQKKAQGLSVSIQAPSSSGSSSKPALAAPQSASKLELQLSSRTSKRAMAASAGARPKAAARPAGAGSASDGESPERAALLKLTEGAKASARTASRRPESASSEEDEASGREPLDAPQPRLPSPPGRGSSSDRAHDGRDRSREERRQRKREEKRKREEWRKQWKEEKKQREREERQRSRSKQGREGEDSDSSGSGKPKEKEQKNRALTWSALNSFGVTTARDAQRKPVGQVSDADLDRRLREQAAEDARGGRLMSEAEVLAKMQKNRGKRR